MTKEAMTLALEALTKADALCPVGSNEEIYVREAVYAITEALAKQEQCGTCKGKLCIGEGSKDDPIRSCPSCDPKALAKQKQNEPVLTDVEWLARRTDAAYNAGYKEGVKDAHAKQEHGEPVCDKDPQGCYSVRCQLGNKCKNTPQPKQEQGEPVAYLVTGPYEKQPFATIGAAASYCKGLNKGFGENAYTVNSLYTTPQPAQKPLTDEQLKPHIQIAMKYYGYDETKYGLTTTSGFIWLARAIETAHGIKENT